MVLGSALHSIHQKVKDENEQIDDQQATLAKSMEALIENVATRQDFGEIEAAAAEDNDLHVELEETSAKIKKVVKHMATHQGHPDDDLALHWERLRTVIRDSSLDGDLDHISAVVTALKSHTESSSSKLFYFIMVNLLLLFSILLWYKAKPSYSYSR